MIIQGVRTAVPDWAVRPPPANESDGEATPEHDDAASISAKVQYMLGARADFHDRNLANFLAVASSWSYSDIDTFARVMHHRVGMFGNETVGITVTNDALFVDTTAYLVQSHDKSVAILTFRGTGVQNVINWMTDVSARVDPFLTAGYVHGGFFRAVLALWPTIVELLNHAYDGGSICDVARRKRAEVRDSLRQAERGGGAHEPGAEEARGAERTGGAPRPAAERSGLRALYITGHSLGGALAVLAAALIHIDPELARVRDNLRGVYTYGQPMVGDQDFANRFQQEFGRKFFRHVYGRDVVPRLPPLTMGLFEHFGSEFRSSEDGWIYRSKPASRALTLAGSTFIGAFAWIQRQLAGLPFLRYVPTPFSWGDHSPLNYLRTSQELAAGAEFA